MNGLAERLRKNPKMVVSALSPLVLLVALVIATGGGNIFGGSSPSAPQGPAQTISPTSAPSRLAVRGTVMVASRHIKGHLWRFTYTVQNLGKTPIAGFQINGPRTNLFVVTGRKGWAIFGAGVCSGRFPNMLVYWSTGPGSPTEIKPGETATFAFDANTTGTEKRLYSLSWSQATAQFAQITGPAQSDLPASGRCKA
jgi:hypothetical protein